MSVLYTNNLFVIAKCAYATPDPVQPDHQYLRVHCVYPLCLVSHVPSLQPKYLFQTFAKFLSLFFSHCCVICSDPLMHELNLAMNTCNQSYLMCNWCAILTPTVCTYVCLLLGEPESLWHLNLSTTTAVCSCVCMSLGMTHCALIFCVIQSIYVTAVCCCVYVIWCH